MMKPENASSFYVHGTHPEEQQRLSLLNTLLNEQAMKELQLKGGEKILDLGSGLGQFSRAMARAVAPSGHVIAVERSSEQLESAKRLSAADGEEKLVEFRHGDVMSLPLTNDEWGGFDVAHARFLLEHVSDPLAVVRSMVLAVRAGGRIILQDDDHEILRIWPELPNFSRAWQAYCRTYYAVDNDPLIGRKLPALLKEAGAQPVRNTWLFFGSCAGNETFPLYVENLIGVLRGAGDAIVKYQAMAPNDLDRALDEVSVWARRPDAALWYCVCWAEGARLDEAAI